MGQKRWIAMPSQFGMPTAERLTDEQRDCFKEAFSLFDTDDSGTISQEEFRKVCLAVQVTPTDDELKVMIAALDTDKSGDIDLNEFLSAMQTRIGDGEDEEVIKEAFQIFDLDGDGSLSHDEISEVLSRLGEKMDEDEIAELIKAVDINEDGQVQVDEFINMVTDK